MKFVTLVAAALIVSATSAAQTSGRATEKSATHRLRKTKNPKAKPARTKPSAAATNEVITLRDEKAYKAEWTFEEMLKRCLEVDAAAGGTQQRRE